MSRLYVAPDGYDDPTIWLDTDTDGERDEAVMVRTGANAAGFDALAGLVAMRERVETLANEYDTKAAAFRNEHLVVRARELRQHAAELRAALSAGPR